MPAARPRTWTTALPIGGIGAFVALYLYAASLYPGGTKLDHTTRGYSHVSNYWCDLLSRVAYDGDINPGRPFAIVATVLLPLSLVPLWIDLPNLFGDAPIARRTVRTAGPLSMVLAAFVFTEMHDLVINLASVFGFTTFVVTTYALARARHLALVGLSVISFGVGFANFAMWRTGMGLAAMPAVQKVAYASFFAWILAAGRALGRREGAAFRAE